MQNRKVMILEKKLCSNCPQIIWIDLALFYPNNGSTIYIKFSLLHSTLLVNIFEKTIEIIPLIWEDFDFSQKLQLFELHIYLQKKKNEDFKILSWYIYYQRVQFFGKYDIFKTKKMWSRWISSKNKEKNSIQKIISYFRK